MAKAIRINATRRSMASLDASIYDKWHESDIVLKPLIILLLLTGCANKYEFTKCVGPDQCTTVKVRSYFNHPKGMSFELDGKTKGIKFQSGEAVKQEVPVKDIVNGAQTLLKLFPIK